MNEKKIFAFVFFFLLTISLISFFLLIINISLIFDSIFFKIILLLTFLNLIIALKVLKKWVNEIVYDINERKEYEKNAHDCILYYKLFNPPDTNN